MLETRREIYAEWQRKRDAATTEPEREQATKWYVGALVPHDLARLEVRFKNEKDYARASILALEALALAGRYGLAAPPWAVIVLDKAVHAVRSAECVSWDQALGQPWPDRTRLAAERKRLELQPLLWVEVRQLRKRGFTLDDALEQARKKLGIGKRRARKYYEDFCLLVGGPGIAVCKSRGKRRAR